MTEKPGRKALFMGVPEKKEPAEEPVAAKRISDLEKLVESGLKGDFSGRISLKGPEDELTGLSDSLNELFSRFEEYAERCTIYRRAFEQQPSPIIIKDSSGSKILTNPSYDSLEEAAATTLEKQGVGSESMVSFVFKDQNPHKREIQIPLKDGDVQVIEERSIPLTDDKGVYAVLFNLNDISAFKKDMGGTTQKPEREETADLFISKILDDTFIPALVVGPDLRISAVNHAFAQMSGIEPETAKSMNFNDIPVLDRYGEGIEDIFRSDGPGSAEITFDFPSGPHIVRQFGTVIQENSGKGKHAVMLYFDITDQRYEKSLLEDQLQELKIYLQNLEDEKARSETEVAEPIHETEEENVPAEPEETEAVPEPEEETFPDEPQVAEPVTEPEEVFLPAEQEVPEPEEEAVPGEPEVAEPVPEPEAVAAPAQPEAVPVEKPPLSPVPETPGDLGPSDTGTGKAAPAPVVVHDVVEFELGGENYAIDIAYAREIVEMMPVTPIPRAPQYLRGVMNLRGEITNIIDINSILGVGGSNDVVGKKIIVLSPEVTGGENIGIIVDDVHSVIQIQDRDIEHMGGGLSELSGYMKGIIKISGRGPVDLKGEKSDEKYLILWIDVLRLMSDLLLQGAQK